MQGRLAIPYLTPAGVVSIRFRTLTDGPKYLSRTGDHPTLYNVFDLHVPSPVICVTEGELDAVIVSKVVGPHRAGGLPAVGAPGAQAWRDYYRIILQDYEKVLVLADGDQAGRDFAKRVVEGLNNAVVVPMPDGHDVNDLYLEIGARGFLERLFGEQG